MSSAKPKETTATGRYDQSLQYAHEKHLPPGYQSPHPSKDWPKENIELLDRYVEWLSGGGASENVIRTIYIPMAGHVLGLNLKPHSQIDLETDLQKAFEYVKAKQIGPDWMDVCRASLEKFRRFMINDRGQVQVKYKHLDVQIYAKGLPDWVVRELERYQTIKQRNWREMRLEENTRRFWCRFVQIWRYLSEVHGVREIKDLKRQHFYGFAEMRLSTGHAATGVNSDIRSFHAFLGFLQDEGYDIPQSLMHWQGLKEPDRLPKFLPDDQIKKLRDIFEERVRQAGSASKRRDTLLDRATFYLLWQSGLRRGEVEELRLEDLDLEGKRLTVRHGKSLIDRTVFMTETTVEAVRCYLAARGIGPTDHVFLYRNQPLSKDLIHGRLKTAGELVGVKVHAHRLRHTCATQLLNAGCKITSIQKFMGHKKLSSTMIYARVHDQTVSDDYYAAMNSVEKLLELVDQPIEVTESIGVIRQTQLLTLVEQLFTPQLSDQVRLEIASQMRGVLNGCEIKPVSQYENNQSSRPPPFFNPG